MRSILLALLILMAGTAYALQYVWLSNDALHLPRDATAYPFSAGDTIAGKVRCNGPVAISGNPQFLDVITTTADHLIEGPNYTPDFHGHTPVFNAPPLEIPTDFTALRQGAATQGHFYAQAGKSYRLRLEGSAAHIFVWDTGTLFDSTVSMSVSIGAGRMCMFFDRPLEVYGHMHGQLTIGSSQSVLLIDNLWYDDATLLSYGGYTPPQATSQNILGIASEADIKIANTAANGRENSNGLGQYQPDRNYTDIVVMAVLWAGNRVTFDQQNDPDSGYVCECTPDQRGKFYLYGGIVQNHCSYFHRSNNVSTGYLQRLRFDPRLEEMYPPCMTNVEDISSSPEQRDGAGIPSALTLDVAPNPFNSSTMIRFSMPREGMVRVVLYDCLGRLAQTIEGGRMEAGEHSLRISGSDLTSGVYFLRLEADHQAVTQKLLLLK